ncbi:ImmA/IrrE family metallo-endopeptidase [Paraburkholderia nemoris]|uniref:ImmA/IrrE family metallo-endopeptidase n=1 Tax=Paraburkholderia nemoris TaxID=2793076 RepID=UPI0038BBD33F
MIDIAPYLASRRLSVEKAAAKAGLSRERFEQVTGGAKATLSEVRGIAKALKLPVSSLIENPSAEPVRLLFRRTLGQRPAESTPQLDVISVQIHDALVVANELRSDLSWLRAFHDLEPTLANAEAFARRFRANFAGLDDLEPLSNVSQVLSNLGVLVLLSRDPTVEGVSAIVDGHAFVIAAARSFMPRMLFTIAHELGHLVAHHSSTGGESFAHIDEKIGTLNSPRQNEEKFADGFASALLLPRTGVLEALKAIREKLQITHMPLGAIEIAWIAHIFYVSFEVAARRFESLDLLTSNGARAFYQKLEDDFGNPEKFAASIDIPPRPDLSIDSSPILLQAAARKVRAGHLSLGKAADLLNVPISALVVANADISV